ncbi:hypothetical protein FOMPIDRAFT_1091962, partial [Fomitopsis schrenkii]
QVLGVTCDNVSANDVMINKLELMLDGFPGRHTHSQCFCHIINLVAKVLLCQFKPPQAKNRKK